MFLNLKLILLLVYTCKPLASMMLSYIYTTDYCVCFQFNLLMEDVMNVGIQRVQALSEEQFRHEIGHLQSVALAQKRQKEFEKQRLQSLNEASNIVLKCKGPCGQEVCKASDMRIANKTHYVNPDKAFEEKVGFPV